MCTHGDSVDLSFPVRQHSHAGCLVAGDQCCGEDEHTTAVLSGAPLPCPSTTAPALPPYPSLRTHSPCTAASEQSPAAIDPCGDVGCLAGFRQEGSPPYLPCMRLA
eukprot:scaffold92228_cov97-Phaeocystis_antarctica.AAC.1